MKPSHRIAAAAFAAVLSSGLGGCATAPHEHDAHHAEHHAQHHAAAPKNIIVLFADGTAATQWELGRYASRLLRNQPFAPTDVVFRQGVLGLLSTNSADSAVTDSAAAATAMSIG